MRKLVAGLLILMLLCPGTWAVEQEEEISYVQPVPRLRITLTAPQAGQTWQSGGLLPVAAHCSEENCMLVATLVLTTGESYTLIGENGELNASFQLDMPTAGGVLTITLDNTSRRYQPVSVTILSPREKLIQDMFDEAERNSHDKQYRYARAQDDWDVGVCKNFVMRLFNTYKSAYRMAEYPGLELHMPLNKSKKDSAPYQYGIEWQYETAEQGCPFEIAAQFKYDQSLTKEENRALCREVLHQVQRGDFFQMVGDYYYGNGPHSLLFMADYDPATDLETWTDSNMKGETIDGVRWGYLQYDVSKTAEWFVNCICTKNRGCTIYRLRDDLYVK